MLLETQACSVLRMHAARLTREEARPGVGLVGGRLRQLVQPPRVDGNVLAVLAVHRIDLLFGEAQRQCDRQRRGSDEAAAC